MMWILSSLNSSIEHLTARKQTFKRKMFVSLHRILMGSCGFILLFFIGTSVVFSQSGGEDFAPNSWEYRWFLLDGWVGMLYLFGELKSFCHSKDKKKCRSSLDYCFLQFFPYSLLIDSLHLETDWIESSNVDVR